MKKLLVIFCAIVFSLVAMVGCDLAVELPEKAPEAVAELETYEELVALNSYEVLLKTHENMYVKNVYTRTGEGETYVQEIVFMQGEGKIDHHMRETRVSDGAITQELSRLGKEWHYYDASDASYFVLEIGETYTLDYTIPDLFDGEPVGCAYLEGDYIVHHASTIWPAEEDYPGRRYDNTYYFNKETKLIEKVVTVVYGEGHNVIETCESTIGYNVSDEEIYGQTLSEKVYASEDRVSLNIVVGHGTDAEATYSVVAELGSVIYATVDGATHLMYSDPECTELVSVLADNGEETVTLYAKPIEFYE